MQFKKWQRSEPTTLYKGRVHIVQYDVVLPNGQKSKYEVDHSDDYAVATLIKSSSNEILLAYQYRFPLDQWIYDLPGGGACSLENPETAAKRECVEEVGIQPNKLIKLQIFYPNPGRSNWPVHLFFCEDYDEGVKDNSDPSENVQIVKLPIEELAHKIEDGVIVDPSLLLAWHTAVAKGLIEV